MLTDFKNRFPAIVIRTLIFTAIKAVATSTLQDELGNWGGIAGSIFQEAVNIADTRSCTTLPK